MRAQDAILTHEYSPVIKDAAETFMIDIWERLASPMPGTDGTFVEPAIAAAMAVITDAAWIQPPAGMPILFESEGLVEEIEDTTLTLGEIVEALANQNPSSDDEDA